MGTEQGKTVSLVLGSGGARGYAHIGVIHWLEEHGYRIQSIYGCSMGALVGGIYAAGKLHDYIEWSAALQKFDIVRLLDPNFGGSGLFKGKRVMKALRELVGSHLIEYLDTRFTAVATDIDSQEEVWINKGPLFDAIRASVAIPTVLTPSEIDGRRLVDGGIINPLPLDPALNDDNDLTIAVNLSARPSATPPVDPDADEEEDAPPSGRRERITAFFSDLGERMKAEKQKKKKKKKKKLKGGSDSPKAFDLISLSIETMQGTITNLKLEAAPPDHLIDVPRNTCSFYEFHRAEELIALGYKLAHDTMRPSS